MIILVSSVGICGLFDVGEIYAESAAVVNTGGLAYVFLIYESAMAFFGLENML